MNMRFGTRISASCLAFALAACSKESSAPTAPVAATPAAAPATPPAADKPVAAAEQPVAAAAQPAANDAPKAPASLATAIADLAKAHTRDGKVDAEAALRVLIADGTVCRASHVAALEEGEVTTVTGAACLTAASALSPEAFVTGESLALQMENLLTNGVGEYAKSDDAKLTLTTSNSETGDTVWQFARSPDGSLRLVGVLETKDDDGKSGPAIKAVTDWWSQAMAAVAAGKAPPAAPSGAQVAAPATDEVAPNTYGPVTGALATWLVSQRERDPNITDEESYRLKDGALIGMLRPEVGLVALNAEEAEPKVAGWSIDDVKTHGTNAEHEAGTAVAIANGIVASLGYNGPDGAACDEEVLSCFKEAEGSRVALEFAKDGDRYVLVGLIQATNPKSPDAWPDGFLAGLRTKLEAAANARIAK